MESLGINLGYLLMQIVCLGGVFALVLFGVWAFMKFVQRK